MVTKYYSANGRVIGQAQAGTYRPLCPDAQGSTVGTISPSGQLENTYRFAPFGTLLQKTGTAPDPIHLWNGASGYVTTGRLNSEYYIRARHYGSGPAQWSTLDPKWPTQPGYAYALCSPVTLNDPSGLGHGAGPCTSPGCCCCGSAAEIVDEGQTQTALKCGEKFHFHVEFTQHVATGNESSGICDFEWWEKRNEPKPNYQPPMQKDQWYLSYGATSQGNKGLFGWPDEAPLWCPTTRTEHWDEPDNPTSGDAALEPKTIRACFRLVFQSSQNCTCPTTTPFVRTAMLLIQQTPTGQPAPNQLHCSATLTPNPKDPYCNYP